MEYQIKITSLVFYTGIIYWEIFNFLGDLFQKIKFSNLISCFSHYFQNMFLTK
jgi:hypothetical protein